MPLVRNMEFRTLPTCAVCNKPVDCAESTTNYITNRIEFRFYCHGATEVVTLDKEELEDYNIQTMGKCFASKLLTK